MKSSNVFTGLPQYSHFMLEHTSLPLVVSFTIKVFSLIQEKVKSKSVFNGDKKSERHAAGFEI
jgi:hypothetical protein